MGGCSSKTKTTNPNVANANINPNVNTGARGPMAGSQYNLDATGAANQIELKSFTIGKYFEGLGDYSKAIQGFNAAIAANPKSTMSYTGLGTCYVKLGDYPRAIDNFDRAIKIDPNNKFAYNGLGVAYDTMKKDDRAVLNYNKAIQLDTTFAYPYNGLGNYFYTRNNFQTALPYYQSAASLSPNNPIILANLACCQVNNNQVNQGFSTFTQAIDTAKAHSAGLSPATKYTLTQKLTHFQNTLSKLDPRYQTDFRNLVARLG